MQAETQRKHRPLNRSGLTSARRLLVATGLTRGNLSTHMAKLVNGQYVEERKSFVDRKPHTEYLLTAAGRTAYREYLKAWRALTAI